MQRRPDVTFAVSKRVSIALASFCYGSHMSSFTKPLLVEITQTEEAGRTLARLLADFEYHIGELGSDDVVKVKKGFKTDFASVPRVLWWLCPPLGRYGKATVVHDWGYERQDRLRGEYDMIFLEGMNVLGVPLWKRSLMYTAVRLFGGREWARRKKAKS